MEGVIIHNIEDDVEHFYTIDGADGQKVIQYMMDNLGDGYDYPGILGYLFRMPWQKKTRWFCSELVAEALNTSGEIYFPSPKNVSPEDIIRHPKARRVC